jgi:hypothetical protein
MLKERNDRGIPDPQDNNGASERILASRIMRRLDQLLFEQNHGDESSSELLFSERLKNPASINPRQ